MTDPLETLVDDLARVLKRPRSEILDALRRALESEPEPLQTCHPPVTRTRPDRVTPQ